MSRIILFHISEEFGIARFEPRASEYTKELWGIDAEHLRNYLLPREYPRVTYYAGPQTSPADESESLPHVRHHAIGHPQTSDYLNQEGRDADPFVSRFKPRQFRWRFLRTASASTKYPPVQTVAANTCSSKKMPYIVCYWFCFWKTQ